MTMMRDQMLVIPFIFLFITSIVFMHVIPTTQLLWNSLASPMPSPPRSIGWDVFAILTYPWDLFLWLVSKAGTILLFFLNVLLVPFSMMIAFPWTAAIFIPITIFFILGLLYTGIPWLLKLAELLVRMAHAVAELIPG